VFGPNLSHGGELAAVMSNQRSGRVEFSLIALDAATGERLGELWDGDRTSLQMARFSPVPGDMRLAATTNRSGDERLLLWNPCTGERRDLDVDGLAGAARFADWSQDGERLLFSTLSQAVQQLYVYNLAADTLTRLDHPAGTLTGATFGSGGEILVLLEDATRPARLVALDGQTGALLREVLPAAPAPAGRPWRAVHFNSSDGQRVHGWLATPEGQGPFPTIVHMIGGPTAVMVEAYHPGAQAWLDHGFAFLSVNYRGCSTFGRDFEVKIHADLGHWEVEDIVAARRYAVETGIADPDRILLTGWSYGGYLTLMGLSLYPDLWAGGMAGVAIADWAIQHEDTADMLRGIQESLLGGTPATAPEQYARSSPITYAERVKAPILIIQGRNDTRTPARPVEHYEARLKALGKPIEVEWFETGHQGSAVDIDLGLQHQERMLRFAYRVLG
jgi:dipeptidyl aminopeptidase/acylaminoacyl peptidase